VEEEQLVNYIQLANRRDRAAARNARDPDHDEAMRDPGPVQLEAMMATLSLSQHWISDSAWKYYAEKYNYLKEKDRERSQSNSQCMRNDLQWCFKKEQIDQEPLHNVLRTGLPKERGRGRASLTGRRN
jgi:hypothetical protein